MTSIFSFSLKLLRLLSLASFSCTHIPFGINLMLFVYIVQSNKGDSSCRMKILLFHDSIIRKKGFHSHKAYN